MKLEQLNQGYIVMFSGLLVLAVTASKTVGIDFIMMLIGAEVTGLGILMIMNNLVTK